MDSSTVRKSWRYVLTGGLVAGTCDITYACMFWAIERGLAPSRVFQSVAAGVLGDASFTGGWASAALGLVLHYVIATSMAVTYYLVARRVAPLWQKPILYGGLYGLLLYMIMNYLVVPLSAARPGSRDALWIALSIAVHMLLIGIPCAIFARRAILVETRVPVGV